MMPFEYLRAKDVAGAVAAVTEQPDAVYLAGGTNLVDHMKLGVATPNLVVDISHLPPILVCTAVYLLELGALRRPCSTTARPSSIAESAVRTRSESTTIVILAPGCAAKN